VLKAAWRALVRLRWLLLSITGIYLWFTPGTPLVAAWGDSSPTREGVQAGLLHAGVLAVIALAASLTVNVTARDALAGALIWLLQPLSFLGVPTRSFALRLSLTLEAVLAAREAPNAKGRVSRGQGDGTGNFIRRAAAVGAERFVAAERDCSAQSGSIELAAIAAPPPGQWAVPAVLLGGAALIIAL
jgi:energy-coupling factor transport system permease protein